MSASLVGSEMCIRDRRLNHSKVLYRIDEYVDIPGSPRSPPDAVDVPGGWEASSDSTTGHATPDSTEKETHDSGG
eukprot:14806506-Alexandrium_andersonii.AAC.1